MTTNLAFVKLRELEREVDANRAVYESFLVRAREIREQEQLDTINVRVLSDAQPPQDRSFPPRRLILLLASLILGGLGGVGCAYAADLWGSPAAADEVNDPSRGALGSIVKQRTQLRWR